MATPLRLEDLTAAALAGADQCVKCGLCLPHCPTYGLTQHEAQGPRGRIALAQGLLAGTLAATPTLHSHLDGCLACRTCEAACPAHVPYVTVLDAARAKLIATRPWRRLALKLQSAWLGSAVARALTRVLLRLAPARWRLGLPRPRLAGVTAPAHAEVALFTGCVGDIAERAVLADAVKLFTAAGMTVSVPPAQGCCGALSQHGGLPQDAATLSACNQQAFAAASTVLPLATGCGAALRDLGDAAFAPKVRDLCATLAAALDAAGVRFAARPMTVGIHTACTQAQVFGARGAIHALLARVPGLTLVPLAPEIGCCGAAGTMFLTHPAQAGALRAPKLAVAAGVDVIVSANIGCTLHLARGLAAAGRAVPVLHPVSLLAAALETAPPARSAAGAQGPW